jgi:hypothetical protein
MRAVWSFWSKPYLAKRSNGWATPAQHWQSWILSLETARRHLPETALYTDSIGADLLVGKLGLEFGEVSTELDALDEEDPGWWAAGKLYTYGLQTSPFIHIDNDVFLWKPLPAPLLQAGVFAQHPEEAEGYYNPRCLEESLRASPLAWLPTEWTWFRSQPGPKVAACCGILGGQSVDFLRDYAQKAIRMLIHPINRSVLRQFPATSANMILIEQYFLSACLGYHRESIHYLFDSWAQATNPVHAADRGYTHLIGSAKEDVWIARRMEARVRNDYPAFFDRVSDLVASIATRGRPNSRVIKGHLDS